MAELQKRDRKREMLIVKLYKSGQTYAQIAERLNISKARVGQIYRRIMEEEDIRYGYG